MYTLSAVTEGNGFISRREHREQEIYLTPASLEAAEGAEGGFEQETEGEFFFDFPVRGRKIKTASHCVAR